MYRLDTKDGEIAVINIEMIKNVINKEDLDNNNNNNTTNNNNNNNNDPNTIDFTCIKSLSLSFQNIFKIDNLTILTNLIKLKLDNNIIQEIEGLEHLNQLIWLDLSFNNITQIKGLDTLIHLTDLTLFNNNISKLENLQNLKNLQVLSIGNNSLSNMESLLYLRCLNTLKVLNLEGNPVCSDPEYRSFVLAHLDTLKYLDYAQIDDSEMIQAREQYQDELEEWKEIKAIEHAAMMREKEQIEYKDKLKQANIIILENLFHELFQEDTEISKLLILPGLQNLVDDYADKVKSITEDIKIHLLEKYNIIIQEKLNFNILYQQIQDKIQQECIYTIEIYKKTVKKLFKEAALAPEDQHNHIMNESEILCKKMIHNLMNYESNLVEQVMEYINKLEIQLENILNNMKDIWTEHFRTIEQLENHHYESVTTLVSQLLDRLSTEDIDDEDLLGDECRNLLNDRDTLNNALNGSHDIHIGKLLTQEELIYQESIDKNAEEIKLIKDNEWKRNRKRIMEIINLKEKSLQEIKGLKEELNHTDEDYTN